MAMGMVRVDCFGVSLDGFGAGVEQSLEHPLGVDGQKMFGWFFATRTFQKMHGGEGGAESGIDEEFARAGFENVGAWVLGRNMFSPYRGPWNASAEAANWRGWWGDEPPYHVPAFVVTHHAREPLVMEGGTTFHFVDGLENALEQAKRAAGDKDVRVGGGVSVVQQLLQAGLVDRLHLAYSPVLLGKGESLLGGLDLPGLGYAVERSVASEACLHVVVTKGLLRYGRVVDFLSTEVDARVVCGTNLAAEANSGRTAL